MLEFILLGLLFEPESGYALKQRFAEGATYFWDADQSQIYRTLSRMEDKGWLRSRLEPSEDGPDQRVYARTPQGRRAFEVWLREDPIQAPVRLPYVAQLFLLGELEDLERTVEFLTSLRTQLRQRRRALEGVASDFDVRSIEDFHADLALRLGLATARARTEWCDDALRRTRRAMRKEPNS
tara:strand:- start:7287 stop:7829 length:543 start_codon:yes stop_codon:yes gene_type:complete